MNATITLREYLKKGKPFVVPNYQRGYVWGKNKTGESALDSVTFMMHTLKKGFKAKSEVFIQGITVSESENDIILIDGQQRTTFFYLLLKYLDHSRFENFHIRYDVRTESHKFLAEADLRQNIKENEDEEYQDRYFFKKTLRIISEEIKELEEEDLNSFPDYLLDKVKFLYIDIPDKSQAVTVFSMMNGNKAEMKAEELIKAELLRLVSLNQPDGKAVSENDIAVEWDNNFLRSRYAREWDRWLQWWNRDDVKQLFRIKTDHVMGLLISTCQSSDISQVSFESFRQQFLSNQKPVEAKRTFDKLRRLQKRFEDAFNNPKVYNWIGAIIRVINRDDRPNFIKWYFDESEKPSEDTIKEYYKLAFLGLTHKQILNTLAFNESQQKSEIFNEKFNDLYDKIKSDNLYVEYPEEAFRLLLRLNIDEDNVQVDGKGRKFDFSIWDREDSRGRSLEHIYPKSKVYHKEKKEDNSEILKDGNGDDIPLPVDNSYIDRDSCRCKDDQGNEIKASEHSIGNLVLLYKDDNSTFNNSSFEEKKNLFFSKEKKGIFKSRHLLHTIYKFAKSKWDGEEIAKNKLQTLKEFREYYYGK